MKTHISDSNSKLGKIPNISLRPGSDCGNSDPCIKNCYAVKIYRMYPNVRNAWSDNSTIARENPSQYFADIADYLETKRPKFFRWHVSGDILNQDYFGEMVALAIRFPETRFLAFTKMHMLDFSSAPVNLSVVVSMWPGLPVPENQAHMPKAWMQNGAENRVPESAIECPGICDVCGMCWDLGKLGRDVVFNKH